MSISIFSSSCTEVSTIHANRDCCVFPEQLKVYKIIIGKDVDYRGIRGAGPSSGVNSIRVAGVRKAGAGVPEVITPEQVYARAEMLLKSGKLTPQQCKDLEDQIREVQRRREKGKSLNWRH